MALLQTTVEADDIITIRTVQGFEIVAKFVQESSNSLKVNKPLLVNGSTTVNETGVLKIPVSYTHLTLPTKRIV